MRITGESSVVSENAKKLTDANSDSNIAKETFKAVFVEPMIAEMMKNTNLMGSEEGVEKDFYQEEFTKAVADQLMDSPDFRWQEIYKQMGISEDNTKDLV